MELLDIGREILAKVSLLEKMRVEIRQRAEAKAEAGAAYDRILAVTIVQLRAGKIFDVDGEMVSGEGMPANLVEKIAKGITWREAMAANKSEALYKALISNIDAVQSELNAYQSLNRNLDRI